MANQFKRNLWLWTMLIVTASFAMITYNSIAINKEAQQVAEIQMLNHLSDATLKFTKWISTKVEMLETTKELIENLSYDEISYSSTGNKYLEIGLDDELISTGFIGLKDGNFLSGDDWTPPEDYDPRDRIWYEEALMQGGAIISDVYRDADTGEETITISAPLYLDGSFVGVLGFDILITNLNFKLMELEIGEDSYAYLLSRAGYVIEHTKHEEWTGKSIYDIDEVLDPEFFMDLFLEDFTTISYKINDENIYAVVRVIPESDWLIGIAARTKDIVSITKVSKETLLFNGIFFFFIIITIRMIYVYEGLLVKTNESLESKNVELQEAYETINKINETLEFKSNTDSLTQIHNRGSFDEKMEEFWSMAARESKSISMILFDIDFFKNYNDRYGHVQGDMILTQICDLVTSLLSPNDFFARYGGEEFVILHYDNTIEQAHELGEQIRKIIYDANMEHLDSYLNKITVSVGVSAMIPKKEFTIGRFIYTADAAMYEAKVAGKNQVTRAF